ncbi:MAG: GatB/YqeY domain-containing protein [Helicobacteraceae bacterium]|jgi:uncharacterized protein YqeY|nr:GatB/YqeY domain-containing protein [Helicobacteraceae bacterium]
MAILEQLREDIKTAMRGGDNFRRDTLRMVNGALKQAEVDKRISLTDDDTVRILQKQIKMRQDAIEQYKVGKRADLVEKETKEIAVIETYLPKQMSDAELEAAVGKIIDSLADKAMGAVMAAAKSQIGVAADAKRISETAKKLLQK